MLTNGVNGNGSANGTTKHKYNPNFTQSVINATGPKASPRVRKVMGSLIQHLHDFARENDVTVDEWMATVELLNESGRQSTDRRNETQLISDILGLESLVDEITSKLALSTHSSTVPTSSAILGPFYRPSAPLLQNYTSILHPSSTIKSSERTLIHGRILDYTSGAPIQGAELDVWHSGPNGLYEQQDPGQPDMNLRGRFRSEEGGKYAFYCLRPASYEIPRDGAAGRLLELLDRGGWRPGHVHFIITAPGYQPLVTQLFDRKDKYITDDAVFAVKEELIVDFVPLEGDPNADFEVPFDFKLVKGKKT